MVEEFTTTHYVVDLAAIVKLGYLLEHLSISSYSPKKASDNV